MRNGDVWFKRITFAFALSIPIVLAGIFFSLVFQSWASITRFGLGFVFTSVWDPVHDIYGAFPFIYGTIASSLLALFIAVPLGIGCAIYIAELNRSKIGEYIAVMVELLAAVPSVVYGLWGIFFLGSVFGLSLLSGGVILAIMILPTITSISREVFEAIPHSLRESALALGATRWETVKLAVLGPARSGVIGAVILGLGRALGETMAVTMVIGNRPAVSASFLDPAYTLAAVIANEFAEAPGELYLSALIELALILLLLTLIVNGLARLLIWKTVGESKI